ncbi:MAG: hypothetical protein RDV41_08910 [Planctomycetota bacterium]|nr:hypothetical protein [Planctomycetota bacterium]
MLTHDSRLALGTFFVLCVVLLSALVILHSRLQSAIVELEGLQRTLSRVESAVGSLQKTSDLGQDGRNHVSEVDVTATALSSEGVDQASRDKETAERVANLRAELESLKHELREVRDAQKGMEVQLARATQSGGEMTDGSLTAGAGADWLKNMPLKVATGPLGQLTPGERETFKTAVLDVLREKQLEDSYRNFMQSAEQMTKHYTTWLELNADQQSEVSSIVYRQYQEMFEIQYGSRQPADRANLGPALNDAQEKHFNDIHTHLNPAQQQKFSDWRQARLGTSVSDVGSRKSTLSKDAGDGR